ncbi:hypothetical protein BJ742DRAFT_820305 [Cladochytrium replicatum]|nr:hypothetical protein BJ742DRAFT_820305 [Cladochytrium replicatum]
MELRVWKSSKSPSDWAAYIQISPQNCPSAIEHEDHNLDSNRNYQCRNLDSKNPSFQVYLCVKARHCGDGFFRIQRQHSSIENYREAVSLRNAEERVNSSNHNDRRGVEDPHPTVVVPQTSGSRQTSSETVELSCEAMLAKSVSENTQTEEELRYHFGPDSFHLKLYGPQKYGVTVSRYVGDCTYELAFRLHNPGEYHVNLWHTYTNYDHINEMVDQWPPLLLQPILQNHRIKICSGCKGISIPQRSTTFGALSNSRSDLNHEPSEILPLCSRSDPTDGIYLPALPNTSFTSKPNNYTFTPFRCRYDQTFGPRDDISCLSLGYGKKLTIVFIGDSHTRVAFEGVSRRIRGDTTPFAETPKWEEHEETYGRIVLRYILDPFLRVRIRDPALFNDADAVVFQVGQWPAASTLRGGHWSLEMYEKHVSNVLEQMAIRNPMMRDASHGPLKLIWQGLTSFPYRTDQTIIDLKDWRTNERLWLFEQKATRAIDRIRQRIDYTLARIDSFSLTLPMNDVTPDLSHYFGTDALDAIVTEILHKLDVCGS